MVFWENQRVIMAFYLQCTAPVCEQFGLTQMAFNILMFLTNNPEFDTAADIVRVKKLTKSHVSSGIRELQKKGYIKTYYREGNRKLLHIDITAAAAPVIASGKEAQKQFGCRLFSGFSGEEIDLCRQFFGRMCDNARAGAEV